MRKKKGQSRSHARKWLLLAVFLLVVYFFTRRRKSSPSAPAETCTSILESSNLPKTPAHLVGVLSEAPSSWVLERGAKVVSPSVLLSKDYVQPQGPSRIIHQTWKNRNASTYPLSTSLHSDLHWRANHPGWIYVLWTDEDNRRLVETRYPDWLEQYDSFEKHIMRVDFVRNLYLHTFGGVYVDLDVVPLSNLETQLPSFKANAQTTVPVAYVGKMGWAGDLGIANAFIASSLPMHPFFMLTSQRSIELITLSVSGKPNAPPRDWIEGLTGPAILGWAAQTWIGSTKAQWLFPQYEQGSDASRPAGTIRGQSRPKKPKPVPIHEHAPNGIYNVLDPSDYHSGWTKLWADPSHERSEEYTWQARMKKGWFGEVIVVGNGRIYPYSWNDPTKAKHCICSPRFSKTFDADRCVALWPGAWVLGFWGSSWYGWTPNE